MLGVIPIDLEQKNQAYLKGMFLLSLLPQVISRKFSLLSTLHPSLQSRLSFASSEFSSNSLKCDVWVCFLFPTLYKEGLTHINHRLLWSEGIKATLTIIIIIIITRMRNET